MNNTHIPLGHQTCLFRPPPPSRVEFVVLDHTGVTQAKTVNLGAAWTTANRIAQEHGRSWITGSDGTTAQITTTDITAQDTAPWLSTIRQLQESKPAA